MTLKHQNVQVAANVSSPDWAALIRSRITGQTHPPAYYGGHYATTWGSLTYVELGIWALLLTH